MNHCYKDNDLASTSSGFFICDGADDMKLLFADDSVIRMFGYAALDEMKSHAKEITV